MSAASLLLWATPSPVPLPPLALHLHSTRIAARLRIALRIRIRTRLITRLDLTHRLHLLRLGLHLRGPRPYFDGAGSDPDPSAKGAFTASAPPQGEGDADAESEETRGWTDDSGVHVQEESYEEQDWTLALPALLSPTSQASFDLPCASIPPPRPAPSSSARTLPMAHTDNALPPSSGPPFLVRAPTARAFPIASAPAPKNKSSLPHPLLIPLLLNSEPRAELSCTSCTPTHSLAHYHSNFHCHSFTSLLTGLSSTALSLLVLLPMLRRGYLIIAYFTLVIA
ncbi:hypothetical protein DFH08DRAFT_953786 [Mycena albidolilacea]|uniref:Uncharacterized protein n=1 Tax=Mycena albidolilacea TaxID=1033008 RepID=A0AAD7ADZ1_9AGAR|nr:hypothetical protein DFH08DRAFT_953786 [Mycena albidolilacea]